MGNFFEWLNNPDTVTIDYRTWERFQINLSLIVVGAVAATVMAILVCYAIHARRLKILAPGDIFRRYTPLRWLFLAIAGGIMAAILCAVQLSAIVSGLSTLAAISIEAFFLTSMVAALAAYALLVIVGPLTPARFRYRPAWYLHSGRPETRQS